MRQRSVPPLKLLRSPLIFVLAQVKITPILGMESKIPILQEALRKRGFPRLATQQTIETTLFGPSAPATSQEKRLQWEFIDKEKRASVVVDSEGLSFQVTKYDVFETFIESMQTVMELFAECVEPTLIPRLGLRYVDLVIPSEGNEIRAYFNETLRGFKIHEGDERKAFFCESVCQTSPSSTFVHRYVEADAGLGFPPDLLPIQLEFPQDPRRNTPFGLLDLDHFSTQETDFSVDTVMNRFFVLHEHHTKAFEASVTPFALEEWKKS